MQESDNDRNDLDPGTTATITGATSPCFFAPDRRYARDKSSGGPTREFKAMVKAFHDQGIKVYLDVVYNHTGEGDVRGEPGAANICFSWRGLDNPPITS